MARRVAEVVSVDIDGAAVRIAADGARHHGITNVRSAVADFVRDWNGPERFDLAFAGYVIEHVPDDDLLLRRIAEVLVPGGRALLFVPTVYTSAQRAAGLMPRSFYTDAGDEGQLVQALVALEQGAALRADLRARDLRLAARFDWLTSAGKYL